MWKELLAQFGGFAVLVAAAAWFLKKLATHWLDKDVETYKARLEAQNAVQTERLRAELAREATEHQVRFSTLHEKQAEVVAETYAHLVRLERVVAPYVSVVGYADGPTPAQQLDAVTGVYRTFQDYYCPRQIYLPKRTRRKVRQLADRFAAIANKRTEGLQYGESPSAAPAALRREFRELWAQAFKEFRDDIPPLLEDLEKDFGHLLGVMAPTGETDGEEEHEEDQEGREPEAPG